MAEFPIDRVRAALSADRCLHVWTIIPLLMVSTYALAQKSNPYPNELPGYHLYENAKWNQLKPFISILAEVRSLLGDPDDATDLDHPVSPYPGDDHVRYVVFTYSKLMPEWDILIYLDRSCGANSESLRLCSVDLVPRHRIPFLHVQFPLKFTKTHVNAVDAAWDEYSDGSGLTYEVYTTRTPYGETLPGDLNRVSYGRAKTSH